MTSHDDKNKDNKPETTGHEWDGIREYNNPLPRWWVWCFIATIIFAIGYCIYYPAWPKIKEATKGIAGWTQYSQLEEQMAELEAIRFEHNEQIAKKSISQILDDNDLRRFAEAGGKATFALHCSQCHGSGGQGGEGFPNLLDDEWLWGGTISDIEYTIRHGIRNDIDEDARTSMMSAFGQDQILNRNQIKDVIQYLKLISGKIKNSTESTDRGMDIYAENCASCHGDKGQGNQYIGAPPHNNHIWLYGGDDKTLFESIYYGRGGVMPPFEGRLSDEEIKKLVIYVHSLSGGE